jgi:T-complex protein 1 subunit alpha
LQITTFADMEGEETFDSSFLGHADEVVEERIADDDVILVKGTKNTSAVCTSVPNLIILLWDGQH